MAGEQPGSFWNELVLQPTLSPTEKDLRDRFVTEYLKDFDAWKACLRVGLMRSVAMQYAQDLLDDSYVAREIQRRRTLPMNLEEQKPTKQAQIESLYWEQATYRGVGASHAARVSALNSLSKIHKLIDDEGDTTARDDALIRAFREMATKLPV